MEAMRKHKKAGSFWRGASWKHHRDAKRGRLIFRRRRTALFACSKLDRPPAARPHCRRMARVDIANLSKIFRGEPGGEICAVRNVSLAVADREFLVLVGPSGCGKSTTLRLIAGLEEISEGTISIDGRVVNATPPQDRDVAMVFQNYALYPHLTVFDNLGFGLMLRKFPKEEIAARVQEAAEILGLTPLLHRRPGELSGGQRQRVAVGRALVRRPKVFLFDEPLSNLDAQLRGQMRGEISRLHAQLGATMIYVTHDQVEAMTMGDRIAVMKEGVIQQVAGPQRLYHEPANVFVAGFIGSPPMNLFGGVIARQGAGLHFEGRAAAGENFSVRLPVEGALQCAGFAGREIVLGLRPEHISIASGATPPEQTVRAVVEMVERMGAETHLHLRAGAHPFVVRVAAGSAAAVGEKLPLAFDLAQARFFHPDTGAAIGSTTNGHE